MWYQTAHSIREFDDDLWDSLAGGEIMMTHRWQRVLEAGRKAYLPGYVMLGDRRGPVAVVVLNTSESFGRPGWRDGLLRRLTVQVSAPFCARHCGVALRGDVALAPVLAALDDAVAALYRRQGRLFLSASNVSNAELSIWHGQRFLAMRQRATMVLDLPMTTYEHYLEGLSREGRQELRRSKRRGAERGVKLVAGPLDGEQEQFYPLLREIFERHRTPVMFTSELFAALEREMPGEVMVFRGYVDGQLAGFLLALMHGPNISLPAAGLRYALAYPSHLYFLLLDTVIQWSIAHGFQRIYAGMTNEDQKARHGFQPQARWFCFRVQPRPLNEALRMAMPLALNLLGQSTPTKS